MTSLDDGSVDLASLRTAGPVPGELAARSRALVVEALRSCDAALAGFEAGSAAFGRGDEQSDLDVCVVALDGRAVEVLDAVEAALRTVEPELDTWDPTVQTFGPQRFLQPSDVGGATIACVDISVTERTTHADALAEIMRPERHGRPLVMYDPDGVLAGEMSARPPFDAAAHRAKLRAELDKVRARRVLFGPFGFKELRRGRVLDAHWIHGAMVLTPLVSLLGIKYRPMRFDFALRYLHEEMPAPVVERLVPIAVRERGGPDGIAPAMEAGLAWVDELLGEIDVEALPVEEHAAQMRAAFG